MSLRYSLSNKLIFAALFASILLLCAAVSCGKANNGAAQNTSDSDTAVSSEVPVDVSLSDLNMELGYRVTRPIKAVGGKKIQWTSSDESIATVDSEGNVNGVQLGECVITATNEFGRSAACSVAVKKVCYLSFDDGPLGSVYSILDALKDNDVKGTFFLVNTVNIGSVKRMVAEGHVLALHTNVNRTSVCYRTMYSYYEGLDILNDKLEELVGQRSNIIRFPGGSSNKTCEPLRMRRIINGAQDLGYRVFDWNASAQDAAFGTDADSSYKYVLATCNEKEEIVLMHDLSFTSKALRKIIPALRARGYTFDTLDNYPDRNYQHKSKYSWKYPDYPAQAVSINEEHAEVEVDGELLLKAAMTPENSTDYIVWQSADEKIAWVSKGGLVKGISLGETVITAKTTSGQTASCTVKVIPKQEESSVDD